MENKFYAVRNDIGGYSIVRIDLWNGSGNAFFTGTYEECQDAIEDDRAG